MKAVILHDQVLPDANLDHKDVLHQAEAITQILAKLGYQTTVINVSLNLKELIDRLRTESPTIVFNLVESIEGQGCFIHLVPSILDHLKLPYTGSKTEALFLTSNKLLTKKILLKAGISTIPPISRAELKFNKKLKVNGLYIIKSVWEHASQGIDENSVIRVENNNQLYQAIQAKEKQYGGGWFAEKYIEGREFNISLLSSPQGPEILPPSEILFENYPPEKAKIVCYRAKWVEDSFEYNHTPRTFEFPPADYPLLQKLKKIARKCWKIFGLHGYARVDFRVDRFNHPFVLEINANPCISPDSGFVASTAQAGISMKQMVKRIINNALQTLSLTPTRKFSSFTFSHWAKETTINSKSTLKNIMSKIQ